MSQECFDPEKCMNAFRSLMDILDSVTERNRDMAEKLLRLLREYTKLRRRDFSRSQLFELASMQGVLLNKLARMDANQRV